MRAWHALGLAGLLVLAGCQRGNDDDIKDYAAMNAIPLKTVCMGRLQIDLPQKGLKEWGANFDLAEVTRMRFPVQDAKSFWAAVEKRKQELESQKHSTEPSLLSLFQRVDENAVVILSRDFDTDVDGYNIDRYLWLGDRGYYFKTAPEFNEVKDRLPRYTQVFTHVAPHDTWDRPQATGFCIDGATVTGDVGEISAGPTVKLREWKHAELSVGTFENSSPNALDSTAFEDLAEEEGRYRKMTQDAEARGEPTFPKDFEVLRQRERSIGGFPGQEAVWRTPLNNGAMLYRFVWRTLELNGTPRYPGISLGLRIGDEEKPEDKPPSEDEIFALWDAVLASLKPRPGA